MKKILYIIAAILTLSFSSCESEKSILELAGEGQAFSFNGSTASIQEVLGTTAYNALTGPLGIPIYTGDNPPSLTGTYNIYSRRLTANYNNPSDPNINTIDNDIIQVNLSNQNNADLTIGYVGMFISLGLDGIPGTGDDETYITESGFGDVFVSGDTSSGGFTIFIEVAVNGDLEDIDTIAISGVRTATGIENLTYAYVSYDGVGTTGVISDGLTWTDDDGFSSNL
jgi:hypothetical protein